jgi:hypothetical protein
MTGDTKLGKFRMTLDANPQRAAITFLSWDTEGGERAVRNLLRDGEAARLRLCQDGVCLECATLSSSLCTSSGSLRYQIALDPNTCLEWQIAVTPDALTTSISCTGSGLAEGQTLELLLPFDARVDATTLLPSFWQDDGRVRLPVLVHAPDWGQLLLESNMEMTVARLIGDYEARAVDLVIELGHLFPGECRRLTFSPYWLAQTELIPDAQLWRQVRRG